MIDKNMLSALKTQAHRDFYDYGELGKSELAPFRIVHWLSKEKSARIREQVLAMTKKWEAILKSVPETKASALMEICSREKHPLQKQDSINFNTEEDNVIKETVCGEKLYVQCLKQVTEGTRKHRVRVMERPYLSFSRRTNQVCRGYWSSWDRYDHLKIFWNEERQQYQVVEYVYVWTEGMSDKERCHHRRNWGRGKYVSELQQKTLEKAKELDSKGIVIQSIKPVSELPERQHYALLYGYTRREHKYFIDCLDSKEIA